MRNFHCFAHRKTAICMLKIKRYENSTIVKVEPDSLPGNVQDH